VRSFYRNALTEDAKGGRGFTSGLKDGVPAAQQLMADLVTDPDDPRLTHGVDGQPTPQAEAYLVLSEEERAKGFIRPVRRTYIHTGGSSPCGATTTMSVALAETYGRQPSFYGATYCCTCQRHLPVSEFVWDGDGTRVGS
jgi:hypothetical protein